MSSNEKQAFESKYGKEMRKKVKELKEENEKLETRGKKHIVIIILLSIILVLTSILTYIVLSGSNNSITPYKVIKVFESDLKLSTPAYKIGYKVDFMSWEPYTAITNRNTLSYRLTRNATWDINGLLIYDDMYLVAMGTGWGNVGDIFNITLSNGNTFRVMIGDHKANKDTDKTNRYGKPNNDILEFIVNRSLLNSNVRKSGTVSVLPEFNGSVINVEKIS